MALEASAVLQQICPVAGSALKRIRKQKGVTLEALSADTNISVSQLSRFESGKREPRVVELERIAERLAVSVTDLMNSEERTAPVVGYVGAGSVAHFYSEGQGPFEYVPAPEGSTESTVAVEVRGDSLGSFFDQWLVFYDDVRSPVTSDLIGKLCVVGLQDGRVLVKKIRLGQVPGTHTLLSQFEPPIYDVDVEWAARVKHMVPR